MDRSGQGRHCSLVRKIRGLLFCLLLLRRRRRITGHYCGPAAFQWLRLCFGTALRRYQRIASHRNGASLCRRLRRQTKLVDQTLFERGGAGERNLGQISRIEAQRNDDNADKYRGGIVRLTSVAEKGAPGLNTCSRCGNRISPLIRRLGSEDPERRARDEMALKVEGVVNGGMHAEEALGGAS
jgi:hypothetical protein